MRTSQLMTTSLILLVGLFALTPIFAAKTYRTVPFQTELSTKDTLIVDYDFTEKNGVACSGSASSPFLVHFTYKGREKIAGLPLILQSARIPTKNTEHLADVSGDFTIAAKPHTRMKSSMVQCRYVTD
ncbi:MAG TPA: hypothetical protein VHZ76_00455 [Gammaproteobacteria bacterium]|jgi:hypothetical protein|nr:hypothetical protein [Gammaproteobacteria bacterium]